MDNNEIKKALECCKTPLASDCENCSYTGKRLEDGVYEGCVNCLVRDALALINSQDQKIKELTADLEAVRSRADETIDALRSEVRELTEELEKRPPRLIITRREPK